MENGGNTETYKRSWSEPPDFPGQISKTQEFHPSSLVWVQHGSAFWKVKASMIHKVVETKNKIHYKVGPYQL